MNIITAYQIKNRCYIKAIPMTKKGIVVHSTGAKNPELRRYVDLPEVLGVNIYGNHWNRSGVDVCVHAFIGYDKNKQVRTVNTLPYNYACWGVGSIPYDKYGNELKSTKSAGYHHSGPSYNYNPQGHIQFEICEDGLTDQVYFNKVYTEAIEYCAYLCKQFNLKPSTIVSHKEAHTKGYGSNHGDPEHWFSKHGKTMNDFRADVKKIINESVPTQEVKTTDTNGSKYMVKVTTSALNIRSGPGTGYKITGCIKDKGSYTIIETINGWGKLKSGAGWISLQYSKKI